MATYKFEIIAFEKKIELTIEVLTMKIVSSSLLFSGRDHKQGDPQIELAILKAKKVNFEPKECNQKMSILKILKMKILKEFEILKTFENEAFEAIDINSLKALSD